MIWYKIAKTILIIFCQFNQINNFVFVYLKKISNTFFGVSRPAAIEEYDFCVLDQTSIGQSFYSFMQKYNKS